MVFKVRNYLIGDTAPTFVVAEGACNHMCNLELARKMIDRVAEAGADAIKFQTYTAEKLVTKKAVAFWGEERISQLEYYRKLDRFGIAEYSELFEYAKQKGIIGFSSPFDKENASMLNELGMPLFKIASCDVPNLDLIKHISGFGKPIILSTGACLPEEIDRAIDVIFSQDNDQLILLACTLSYPTRNQDANLMRIKTLKKRYPDFVVGLSDHTEPDTNMVIPSLAVGLGAKVIEKHFTLDRTMTGSGHFFAVDPDDLRKMVQNIRLTELVLGDGGLGVAETEKEAWKSARRSIVARQLIKKGTIISRDFLAAKRPGQGISPDKMDSVIGRRAKKDIFADEFMSWEMFE